MKRYERYMDGVKVSDVLHEKLTNLKAPEKRPNPWLKWGALAAVVALVIGVGAWAASRPASSGRFPGGPDAELGTLTTTDPQSEPDPYPVEPGGDPLETPRGGWGYEVWRDQVVEYIMLPALNWADASTMERLDYCLAPPGADSRGAEAADVTALCGGEEAMRDHLLWDGMDWRGTLWFLEDGTPQAASLYTVGEGLRLSLEIMKGGEVPSCVVCPDEAYERAEWGGVAITALENTGYCVQDDGTELRESREVSFVADGVGYKLCLYAADADRADELCARFARYAIDGGLDLDVLPADGAVDNAHYSVGEPRWNDSGEASSALPDKGTPPPEMPTSDIIHPGEEGYVEPLPEP